MTPEAIDRALQAANAGQTVLVIAAGKARAEVLETVLAKTARLELDTTRTKGREQVAFPSGGKILLRSANANTLRGVRADVVYAPRVEFADDPSALNFRCPITWY